jgi:glycosyltransferase-like protein
MTSVGLYTYSTRPRGSVVHATCLAEALARLGVDVTLYALSKAGDTFYRELSSPVVLLPAAAAPADPDALIQQRIEEFRSGLSAHGARHEIYHAEDCLAASGLIAARAALGPSLLARTVHHVEHYASAYLAACQRRSIANAALLLSVSELTQREVKAEFSRSSTVIYNGVDPARFAQASSDALPAALSLRVGDALVLSVGGVEERKNSLNALAAIELAHARHPELRWAIAGGASIWDHGGYRQTFAEKLAHCSPALQARVHVLGPVSEAELGALYRQSRVLLCPSLKEGFGLCALEAMAARSAVIASVGAPFAEFLDERTAKLVPPDSPRAIAAAVTELLDDAQACAAQSERAFQRAQRFSWQRVAEAHLSAYERALGAPQFKNERGAPFPSAPRMELSRA